jgi:hypothetical protein
MHDMTTINFYRQARVDGGKRTGVEIDGESVLEQFERGNKAEDSALVWFVDIRCSGANLPKETEAAREWLLEKASIIEQGVRQLANELAVGIDFCAPISRTIPNVADGVTVEIWCSAIRRIQGREIAKALDEIGSHWREFLKQLEILEPLAR